MTLPYTNPTPTDWAEHELRIRIPGTDLDDWVHTTADDGRPLHTARVHHPDAAWQVQQIAESSLTHGLEGAQQRPVLDYSVPGRLEMWWLFNGEWIVLWAPNTAVSVPKAATPVRMPQKPVQAAPRTPVTPGADAKRLIPGGRLRFGRRTNTPKETRR